MNKTARRWSFDEINDTTGFANGVEFEHVDEVWDYFTVESLDAMMPGEEFPDQETLDSMASAVIENGWHMERQASAKTINPKRKANMKRQAETFRGFDLSTLSLLVQDALNEIKVSPNDYWDSGGESFDFWVETIMGATGRIEDFADVLGIDQDDPEWQEAVKDGWDWDYIMDVEGEINDKIAETMERENLPGYITLGGHEHDGSYGLLFGINYDEAEALGIVSPEELPEPN